MKIPMIVVFTLCLMTLVRPALAQDLLVKNDSTRLKVRILELKETTIRYFKAEYPEGPVYVIERREVARIVYADGQTLVFAPAAGPTAAASYTVSYRQTGTTEAAAQAQREERLHQKEEIAQPYLLRRHGLVWNVAGLGFAQIDVGYTYQFAEIPLSLYAPLYVGIGTSAIHDDDGNTYSPQPKYGLGLGASYVARSHYRFQFSVGPLLRWQHYGATYVFNQGLAPGLPTTKAVYEADRFSFMANFAMSFRIHPRFSIMANMMLGGYADSNFQYKSGTTEQMRRKSGMDVYAVLGPCFHF